jgi:hypothetical protein
MTIGMLKNSLLATGLVAVSIVAGATNSSDTAQGSTEAALTTGTAIPGAPVVMRASKANLLVGAHVDGHYFREGDVSIAPTSSSPNPLTFEELEPEADAPSHWMEDARLFLEGSSERTFRRAAYVSRVLGDTFAGAL